MVGSRYLNGVTVVNWPLTRLILSYGANLYTRIVTWMPIKDATGGLQVLPADHAWQKLDLRPGEDGRLRFPDRDELQGLDRKGLRHPWRSPFMFVDRRVGISKMNNKIVWQAMWMVWKLRFLDLVGKAVIVNRDDSAGSAAAPSRPGTPELSGSSLFPTGPRGIFAVV